MTAKNIILLYWLNQTSSPWESLLEIVIRWSVKITIKTRSIIKTVCKLRTLCVVEIKKNQFKNDPYVMDHKFWPIIDVIIHF